MKHFYAVLTKAVPGQEGEFQHWYDNQHIPDCLKVEGVTAVTRYQLHHAVQQGEKVPSAYASLAVYEFESDDPMLQAKRFRELAGSEAMPLSDSLVPNDTLQLMGTMTVRVEAPRD